MGQDAHRKYKEFKAAEKENKRFPAWCSDEQVRIKELEWKLQEKEDNEDFERGLKLLNKYEY